MREGLLVFVWLAVALAVSVEDERSGTGAREDGDALLEATAREGKLQYNLLAKEAETSSYGDCYQAALRDLHKGCSRLDDQVQSRLALSFTNCYLARFGWAVYPCGPGDPLAACMEHMDARATSVYSALLTSTLAMCHFLEAQTWRKDTARAVLSLKETSLAVSSQLSLALQSAASLRQQMDQQLLESRQALSSAFREIRLSAEEQRGLVEGIFDKVAQLHRLVMGEFSGLHAVVFYVAGVAVTLMVTCSARTVEARLPILALLAAALLLERLVVSAVLAWFNSGDPQENILTVVSFIRRMAGTFAFIILARAALSFKDPVATVTARLQEVMTATKQMSKLFGVDGAQDGRSALATTVLTEAFEHSESSDDTYDPNEDSDLEECLALLSTIPPPESHERDLLRYSLRPRKAQPPNPMVSLESPQTFRRLVRQQEAHTRYKSRAYLASLARHPKKREVALVSTTAEVHEGPSELIERRGKGPRVNTHCENAF